MIFAGFRYLCSMETPKEVKVAAASLIEQYGDSFEHLGKYRGRDVWEYCFPEDVITGYPVLFLFKRGKVEEVGGLVALNIVSLLVEEPGP